MVTATVAIKPTNGAPTRTRGRLMIAGAAGGVVALGLIIWLLFSLFGGGEPRLNDNTVVLSKFICSGDFAELGYDKQRQFYKVLEDRDDNGEIDQLFRDGRLSESEYRTALEAAWLGKHINRVEKYYALPPGRARDDYIDKMLSKKIRQGKKTDEPGAIKVDETAAEMKVESWPASVREQWKTFHSAYSKQKKTREAAATQRTGTM